MEQKFITDKQGNKVLPITHVDAVRDDEGNTIASLMGTFEDEVRGLVDTPHQEYVTVDAFASLPAEGSADTIYRVSNWDGANGAQKAGATFKDCNCFGVKYIARVSNLKSAGEDDEVIFDNVVADTIKGNSIILDANDYYDEHAVDRMCINVPIVNCYKLDSTVLWYGNNILKQCLNAYSFTKRYSTSALLKGQPVDIDNGVSIATAAPFAVVAEGVPANEFVYVLTGHTFMGLCVSGTYDIGDEVYISNGKFTKTQNGSAVGKVVETKTLSADGEVMIRKY